MKTHFIYISLCILLMSACKKDEAKPMSESIRRVWKAKKVKQNDFVVYEHGVASNAIPGYINFRLNLSDPSKVILIEFNDDRFNGEWELVGTQQLILSSLIPEPTFSGGTINYSLQVVNEDEIILTQSTPSIKTGNTINEYTLVPE